MKNLKANQGILFTQEEEYNNFKNWVKEEGIELDDFVVIDHGATGGTYQLTVNFQAFANIFGMGWFEDPEFDMIFS